MPTLYCPSSGLGYALAKFRGLVQARAGFLPLPVKQTDGRSGGTYAV